MEKYFLPYKNKISYSGFYHYNCIFYHIPKTGGVSVAKSIFNTLGGAHFTYLESEKMFDEKFFISAFKFAFVRDPIDRYISAINFLLNGGFHAEDALWAKEHLVDINDINFFIKENALKLLLSNWIHFRTQTQFLINKENNIHAIDYLGKFETIDEDFHFLCNKLNIPHYGLTVQNKTKIKFFDKNDLNTESKSIIFDLYKEDFVNFKYKMSL